MNGETTFLDEFNATAPDLSREVNVVVKSARTHHYSQNEQIVGTWIDGKTLYEKTIQINTPSTGINNIQHEISNFGTLAKCVGAFLRADDLQLIIPNYSSVDTWIVTVDDFSSTQFKLRVGTSYTGSNAITTAYITIQYTKTT